MCHYILSLDPFRFFTFQFILEPFKTFFVMWFRKPTTWFGNFYIYLLKISTEVWKASKVILVSLVCMNKAIWSGNCKCRLMVSWLYLSRPFRFFSVVLFFGTWLPNMRISSKTKRFEEENINVAWWFYGFICLVLSVLFSFFLIWPIPIFVL